MVTQRGPRKGRIELIAVFYERFLIMREEAQWREITDRGLAKIMDIHPNNFARWKDGIGLPDAVALIRIADVFDVSVDWLLGRTDVQKKKLGRTRPPNKDPKTLKLSYGKPPSRVIDLPHGNKDSQAADRHSRSRSDRK